MVNPGTFVSFACLPALWTAPISSNDQNQPDMLKRTLGRFLLTVLVITGLAGTINNNSLSKQERKSAINLMKDTRADVLKSVKGLSNAQLNFKPSADRWSVKECMYHIAIAEKNLWDMMEKAMKGSPNPEKRSEIKMTDAALIQLIENRTNKVKTSEPFEPKSTHYKPLNDAISAVKTIRADQITYMKFATENMDNSRLQGPFCRTDCYQSRM